MKKKPTAALLDSPQQHKLYHIEVETTHGNKITIILTSKLMAQQETNRIRAAGIYCGEWIRDLRLWESDETTFMEKA